MRPPCSRTCASSVIGPITFEVDELVARVDRAVDVGLGREVDDRVAAIGRVRDRVPIGDRAVHEAVARIVGDVRQVARVARVGERVEVHDLEPGVARRACGGRSASR